MYFYEELPDRDKEILLTAIQDMNGKTMLRFAHSHNVYLPSEAWEEPDILKVRLIGWFYTDISENFEDIEVKYKNKYFIDDTCIYFMDGERIFRCDTGRKLLNVIEGYYSKTLDVALLTIDYVGRKVSGMNPMLELYLDFNSGVVYNDDNVSILYGELLSDKERSALMRRMLLE